MWSSSLHRLCVEVQQTRVGIVGFLYCLVCFATVELIKLLGGVERVGVKRLVSLQLPDLALDQFVGVTFLRLPAATNRHRRPEADIDVGMARAERIKWPLAVVA